jgi:hypothetical protein
MADEARIAALEQQLQILQNALAARATMKTETNLSVMMTPINTSTLQWNATSSYSATGPVTA